VHLEQLEKPSPWRGRVRLNISFSLFNLYL
jgi:hypothetical protein